MAASIREYGFASPLVARRSDGRVIIGHTRLKAAVSLGLREVPVRYVELDDAKAAALAVADNKLGELADWDRGLLAGIFAELDRADTDLLLTGFPKREIDQLLRAAAAVGGGGDDVDPDALPEMPVSVGGELYELGEHRLLCGDATAVADVERVMDGARCQLVFTDPPYNVDYTGRTADALKIASDDMNDAAFLAFLIQAFSAMLAVAAPGAVIYVCHSIMESVNFHGGLRRAGWLLSQALVWVKDQFVFGRRDYQWQHEALAYGWAPGAPHAWYADRKQTTVWNFDRPRRSEEHPTMKPTPLIEYALGNSSGKGDLVLDPFGGSGSTLIACARTARRARLVEIDPRYCDVIRRRWTKWAASAGVDPGPHGLV